MERLCENCDFCKQQDSVSVDLQPATALQCRRYPSYEWKDWGDWCGEFKPVSAPAAGGEGDNPWGIGLSVCLASRQAT